MMLKIKFKKKKVAYGFIRDIMGYNGLKSKNTQHTRVKQNTLFFMQKGTQLSQACS
jgi:hypothetical protein